MPKITTALRILDSSGQLANGSVYFRQSARYTVPEGLVTTTQGRASVKHGVITDAYGGDLVLPQTPSDQGVEIVEEFSGDAPVTYTVQVPAGSEVEYSDLRVIVPPDAGGGIPSWVQELLAVLAAVDGKVNLAQAAANDAATSAAETEALKVSFVTFRSKTGAPLAGRHVIITVDEATGEIDNITSEAI
jgi:hypothetical protein